MLIISNSFLQYRRTLFAVATLLVLINWLYVASSFAEEVHIKQNATELITAITDQDDPAIAQDKERAQNKTILRSRYARVNVDYVAGADDPDGKDTIEIPLFDDMSVTGIKERLERRSPGSYTWFGYIKDAAHTQVGTVDNTQVEENINEQAWQTRSGQIIIVVENDAMAANVTSNGRMFQIRAIGNGIHAIREIDQAAFPDECEPLPVMLPESQDLSSATFAADGETYIDVLVVYSDDTVKASANINNEIQLAIDETNQSYMNSNINQRLRLVHSRQVIYSETGDLEQDLDCITDVDGCLDEIHQWRDEYGADVVSFWVESGNYCGIAWLMQTVSHGFEPYAYSTVKRTCATGIYAFGHELGHNMGAHHDRANANEQGAYPYSYGYQDPDENWRTIMAYNCPSGCPRVQYWSNPDVMYHGDPMGVPAGLPDAADNHRTLNNTASTVSGFRSCWDNDGDGYPHYEGCGLPQDCNDYDYSIYPGAAEECDGVDNDCDGSIDEDFPDPIITPPLQPGTAAQGVMGLDVIINGSGFVNGATCEFCDRVTLNSCTFESGNRMRANINVDPSAEFGPCEVSVINPECGSTTCTDGCFEILFDCQKADIEEDGRIDGLDLAFLGRAFGMNESSNPETWWREADLDSNGWVDGDDLALLAANFGEDAATCD